MKQLLVILFLTSIAIGAEMLDVDYNFIEHAFENTKAVSEQDFQKAINSKTLEPVPDTFGGKLKAFLFGRKYITNTPATTKVEQQEPVSDAQMIQEAKNGIYFIKLIAPIIASDNKIIPAGNYKIQQELVDGESKLAFYQGHQKYGMLNLYKYTDNQKKEHDLMYSRVDIISDTSLRIVYATIDDTKCAVARVYMGL